MHSAVLTAVLLLVVILDTEASNHGGHYGNFCRNLRSCGDGWKEVRGRCMKTFLTPKSLSDARTHCRSMNGYPLMITGFWRISVISCLSGLTRNKLQPFWTGVRKTPQGKFKYLNGSAFKTPWYRRFDLDRYKGKDACVMFDFKSWTWITAPCSEKKAYACVRKRK